MPGASGPRFTTWLAAGNGVIDDVEGHGDAADASVGSDVVSGDDSEDGALGSGGRESGMEEGAGETAEEGAAEDWLAGDWLAEDGSAEDEAVGSPALPGCAASSARTALRGVTSILGELWLEGPGVAGDTDVSGSTAPVDWSVACGDRARSGSGEIA